MAKQFVIGASRRIITPPLGTPLAGYPYERPAESVNDDLTVNAVAMGYNKATALLISADLVGFSNELVEKIKTIISENTAVLKNNIIICAIHTHSGPSNSACWGTADDIYNENILIPRTLEAVKEAVDNAVPAVMGIGTTNSNVGINRRELTVNGEVILGQNPYGIYDPEMTVLAFKSLEGKPIVNIINYGAHATASGEGPVITRDWPGYMVDSMEKNTSALTVFINGAEGDIGPRLSNGKTTGGKPDGDISMAREVGSIAAIDAICAYRNIKEYTEVMFKTISGDIELPYREWPALDELYHMRDMLGDPDKLIEVEASKYQTLSKQISMLEKGKKQKKALVMHQVLFALNSVVLVPFAYEPFVEITLRLKHYSPYSHTLPISNANGKNGYLPSRDQLCRGGYEVEMFLYSDENSLMDNTDDNIIREYLKMIEKLMKEDFCAC